MTYQKDIPGFEGFYTITSHGVVNSLTRKVSCKDGQILTKHGKTLKPRVDKDGYLKVTLCRYGKRKYFFIHRLVLLTFSCHSKLEVNHRDGDKTNNHYSNLHYCTSKENQQHRVHVLGKGLGQTNPAAKLTTAAVISIKYLREEGIKFREIAEFYNVHITTIERIVYNKRWTHVS